MVPRRTHLLGPAPWREPFARYLLVAPAVTAIVAALYVTGVFEVGGGVVFVPGHAALVGLVAAALVGLRRDGALAAWVLVYGALFGYAVDHYVFGSPHKPLAERLLALVSPDGLAAFALMALVLGGVAYAAGAVVALVGGRLDGTGDGPR